MASQTRSSIQRIQVIAVHFNNYLCVPISAISADKVMIINFHSRSCQNAGIEVLIYILYMMLACCCWYITVVTGDIAAAVKPIL